MNEQKPISHLIAGLIIGAIMIIFSLVVEFAGLQQVKGIPLIGYGIIMASLILFISIYGKAMNNQVTFGNLFSYGFKTTAVLMLTMILFTIIFFLLFPDIKEKLFESARQKMEEKIMPEDEIMDKLSIGKKMFWPLTIGSIALVYAVVGAIASLIGAAITKKNLINPIDQLDM